MSSESFSSLPGRIPLKMLPIHDEPQSCPYIDTQVARMPVLWPSRTLLPSELDELLARGRRRSGRFFYFTRCPECSACEPTRVNVHEFLKTRSMRRVEQRGDRELRVEFDSPMGGQKRLDLFNRHRHGRSLNRGEARYDLEDFESFLVDTACPTMEMSLWFFDQLISVSIIDCGESSLSAVYTYFDPEYSRFSPGTYAILRQIRWALETGRTWVYLGMYVSVNSHLKYKDRYLPQERLKGGAWQKHLPTDSMEGSRNEPSSEV